MIVDIVHDTACPWCWIGIKNLFNALQQWQDEPVELQWHPFFLDKTIPSEGIDFYSFIKARKGIKSEELNWLFDYTQQRGKVAGVKLNFDKISLAVNTKLSHRLIAFVPNDIRNTVVEAVYQAYFENGLNIGDIEVLIEIGKAVGLNPHELRKILSRDAPLNQDLTDTTFARHQGIISVPFFTINNLININGSYSPQVFIRSFNRASLLSLLNPPYWF